MCCDDEEFCIASISVILNKLGIDVQNCVDFGINGQEAVEMAKLSLRYGFRYKLILTDFNMPIMDGIEST
jgi:CheY-like chemotaxis protein